MNDGNDDILELFGRLLWDPRGGECRTCSKLKEKQLLWWR